MNKSSTGLDENVAGLLCYVLGWVSGLVFLLIEKESKFVKYHALQSIVVFGALTVVSVILSILSAIPFIGLIFSIINGLIGLLAFILWIVLMVKAYQKEKIKLPWAGEIAEKQAQ